MPVYAVVFGLVLAGLAGVSYSDPARLGTGPDGNAPKPGQMTSLIPAAFGAVLLLLGLVSLAAPAARKHAMHLAAAVGLLGAVGGLVPGFRRGFEVTDAAVRAGLAMTILCVGFVLLCVNSFIQARKARQAAGRPAA